MTPPESDEAVRGERDATAISGAPSLQSRVSSVLAVGLMSVLGLGMLTWYYANAMTRQSKARQAIQATSTQHAQADMPLPGLGRIDPPAPPAPPAVDRPRMPAQESPALAVPLREIPLAPSPTGNAAEAPAAPKTPAQLTLERQLSGAVFSSQGTPTPPSGESPTARPPASSPAIWLRCCAPLRLRWCERKYCRRSDYCCPRGHFWTARWKRQSTRRSPA